MAAKARRSPYVSDYDENTSFSESESNSETLPLRSRKDGPGRCRPRKATNDGRRRKISTSSLEGRILTANNGRRAKCHSKNALLARENRLRKKLYVTGLENEARAARERNRRLTTVVENQVLLIRDLKREVTYLKSALANSSDIATLVRNINHNTGMSVGSSLDAKLSLSHCVSKPRLPVARKTAHPFRDTDQVAVPNTLMAEWDVPQPLFDDFGELLMNDASLGVFDFGLSDEENLPQEAQKVGQEIPMEHNYTCLSRERGDVEVDDVGVCLHVSKHRVSLEFCPACSDRARTTWDD